MKNLRKIAWTLSKISPPEITRLFRECVKTLETRKQTFLNKMQKFYKKWINLEKWRNTWITKNHQKHMFKYKLFCFSDPTSTEQNQCNQRQQFRWVVHCWKHSIPVELHCSHWAERFRWQRKSRLVGLVVQSHKRGDGIGAVSSKRGTTIYVHRKHTQM